MRGGPALQMEIDIPTFGPIDRPRLLPTSLRMETSMVRHESQMSGKPSEMASQTECFERCTPNPNDAEQKTQGDLAPVKGILAGLFIGGVMWLMIIYVLARVS
jgi:hypothetical protein